MKSLRFLDRRSGYSLASLGLLLGMVTPSLVPAFASAAVMQSRSIAMSTTAADATGVDYKITFTPSGASWQHLVVDWCDAATGPVVGSDPCDSPTAFDAKTGVTVASSAIGTASIDGTDSTASHTVIDGTAASTTTSPVTFTLSGVHNPSTTGTFYARLYTYATVDYVAANDLGTTVDSGGIALATADTVGVSAAVRESMTFCVSHSAPTVDCTGTDAASITLGHGTDAIAIDSSATDTAQDYAQVSTNAVNGAIVSMKNNNNCGGLKRSSASGCDIAAAGSGNAIAQGTAMFGMKVGTQTTLSGGLGTITPAADFAGTSSNYGMTYTGSTGTGVSSNYGAEIFHTGGPISNVNVPMTFAASASNATPAGLYQATLSLIATGTY